METQRVVTGSSWYKSRTKVVLDLNNALRSPYTLDIIVIKFRMACGLVEMQMLVHYINLAN